MRVKLKLRIYFIGPAGYILGCRDPLKNLGFFYELRFLSFFLNLENLQS